MEPFFPVFFCASTCPWRIWRCDLIPEILCFSRKIDFDSGGSISWKTQPRCFDSFQQSYWFLATTFLELLLGWLSHSVCLKKTLVAEFASRFRSVSNTYGRMPIITRRIRAVPKKVILARSLTFLSGWISSPRCVSFRRSSSVIQCLRSSEQERMTCPFDFPLTAFSWFPWLNANISPFLDFRPVLLSRHFRFDSEVVRSDRLIDVSSYHTSNSLSSLGIVRFWSFSCSYILSRSDAEQTHVFVSCTNFPKHFVCR